MKKAFTIKEALSFGWNKTMEHFGFFVSVTLCFFAAMALLDILGGTDKAVTPYRIFDVIGTAVSYFAMFSFVRLSLKTYKGKTPEVRDIFEFNWRTFGFFILASVIYALSTAIGLVLLIIPGILLMVRLGFYPYALIEESLGFFECLKKSYFITRGYFWPILGLTVLIGLINLAGLILFGLGLLITMPLGFLAMAYVYEKLRAFPVPQAVTKK